jgi:hypothetical protein
MCLNKKCLLINGAASLLFKESFALSHTNTLLSLLEQYERRYPAHFREEKKQQGYESLGFCGMYQEG